MAKKNPTDDYPVGSIIALPKDGGAGGAFVVPAPGKLMRFGDYEWVGLEPEAMFSIDEWRESEGADSVELVYKGKGKVPSRATMMRHWEVWWRKYLASRKGTNPEESVRAIKNRVLRR